MYWKPYVPVGQRQANAKKKMDTLRKQGQKIEPVEIEGKKIVKKFWGIKWCDHLESFADYSNRLPRGRSYVRNGSVCHLGIKEGHCEAMVSGSELYKISVKIKTLPKEKWESIKKRCTGKIGSILELLQGQLSNHVMEIVTNVKDGLFPSPKEIDLDCSCPDWADMCKHVAAVLYGIGSRLDTHPDLLFQLRGVDASELIDSQLSLETSIAMTQLDQSSLSDIFGIELDSHAAAKKVEPLSQKSSSRSPEIAQKNEAKKAKLTSKSKEKKSAAIFNVDQLTGKSFRCFREKLHLSVQEMASLISITPASIYRWEKCPNVLNLRAKTRKALIELSLKAK
ncbi:MAG: SWIM zinc finger family protein [Parachlamydia sp.]|jgi:uncharacterized Zn finger protein|nr:SWIM zinc finger family protein [Parachlamydia sp.]